MNLTVEFFVILLILAMLCEFIDAALGMGYGTILSPLLLILGFDPLISVPAILFSQAIAGLVAAAFHNQFGNVCFRAKSRDLKVVLLLTGTGIFAAAAAALLSINLPGKVVKTYIGLLVLVVGIVLLTKRSFTFSWKKIIGLGLLSAFNKGLSGGGFGPIMTGGQVISGQDGKAAIGITTLVEAPVCIVGFFVYLIARTAGGINGQFLSTPFSEFAAQMFSPRILNLELLLALCIGSVLIAPFGAFATRAIKKEKITFLLGGFISVLGIWTLIKTCF